MTVYRRLRVVLAAHHYTRLKDGKPLELYEEARRSGDWKQISSIKLIYKQLTGYKTA